MKRLLDFILTRAGYRCAWCDTNLRCVYRLLDGRSVASWERGRACIDCLDVDMSNRSPSNMVASCFECALARQSEWPAGTRYTTLDAVTILGSSIAGPSTFSIYLDSVRTDLAPGVAFNAALARVEAQRWAELENAA